MGGRVRYHGVISKGLRGERGKKRRIKLLSISLVDKPGGNLDMTGSGRNSGLGRIINISKKAQG